MKLLSVIITLGTLAAQTFPGSARIPSSLRRPGGAAVAAGITLDTSNNCAGGASGATTGSVSAAGNFVVVGVSVNIGSSITVSDSKGNSYTALTKISQSPGDGVIYYAKNATTGSGFTVTVAGTTAGFCVLTFNNVSTTSPFDVQNGAGLAASQTIQPGSVTPSASNSLIVTSLTQGNSTFSSIDSSFIHAGSQAFAGGSNFANDMAYIIQIGGPTAVNPLWTVSIAGGPLAAEIAVFK